MALRTLLTGETPDGTPAPWRARAPDRRPGGTRRRSWAPAALTTGPLGVGSREEGQDLGHLWLLGLHLVGDGRPIGVALVVHVGVHEEPGLVRGREEVAVEAVPHLGRVDRAHPLHRGLDQMGADVALEAVVVGHTPETLLEALPNLHHAGNRG